jgi:hypothetical protein
MELLPPVGWADVATKHDIFLLKQDFVVQKQELVQELALLEQRLEARFERGFRQIMVTMTSRLVAGIFAAVLASLLR